MGNQRVIFVHSGSVGVMSALSEMLLLQAIGDFSDVVLCADTQKSLTEKSHEDCITDAHKSLREISIKDLYAPVIQSLREKSDKDLYNVGQKISRQILCKDLYIRRQKKTLTKFYRLRHK